MSKSIRTKTIILLGATSMLMACGGNNNIEMGRYAYDAKFLKDHGIEYTELVSKDGKSKVMVVPAWQGRVMTTSASGDEGDSYGWINYRFIEEGKTSSQFNPVGGEERFWLGPEGGPYSLYFKSGQQQVYDNWVVPAVIDTEAFEIKSQTDNEIHFVKDCTLANAAGSVFDMNIDRVVSLMDADEVSKDFGIEIPDGIKIVAYKSDNTITNTGNKAWSKDGGMVSVWMLGCFNPTPTTTVFIPYNENVEGKIVNDEYFGKIPENRLVAEDGLLYFKIDGKYRSKLGLPSSRATDLCGSYDSSKRVLTVLWCNIPEETATYLNGQWGEQANPFDGDVINSYNDGPVEDGSIMGPFYEIETSSPGAALTPGESLTHSQKVVHLQGTEEQLAPIVKKLFGADLNVIKTKFQ